MLNELLPVGGGHCNYKTINIGHNGSPRFAGDLRMSRSSLRLWRMNDVKWTDCEILHDVRRVFSWTALKRNINEF
jgi:hypothetical protein